MAKYTALKDGYLGTHRYGPADRLGQVSKGEVFEWSGPKGKWMQPIETAPVVPKETPEPVTLSEIQKETPPPLSGDVVEAQEEHDKALDERARGENKGKKKRGK